MTGLIGGEIAAKLCESGYKVWGLVRANTEGQAAHRLKIRFARSGKDVPLNIFPVCGDIRKSSLGIDKDVLRIIRRECNVIIHAAGETSFKDDNKCYSTNVKGVYEIIEEVKNWSMPIKVFFVSTSFVTSGPEHSEILEDSPQIGYRNGYINSKRISEQTFYKSGLDVTILRPSIVVSKGICDRRFARSILWFILAAQEVGKVPINQRDRIDIVPVDYVAECTASLIGRDAAFDCYHLTAGAEFSVYCQDVADIVQNQSNKKGSFVPETVWAQEKRITDRYRSLMVAMDYYTPFINADVTYSSKRIKNELGNDMPKCPKFTEYCRELLDLISWEEVLLESTNP